MGSMISDNTWTNLPHFADKETEDWSGMVIGPRSHSELLGWAGIQTETKRLSTQLTSDGFRTGCTRTSSQNTAAEKKWLDVILF